VSPEVSIESLFESLVELEAEVETRDADGMVAIEKE
jgi:hypothetical protein